MLKWNINFLEIQKPTIKAVQAQDHFKEWLKQIELHTVYDFKYKAISRLQISRCRQFYKVKEDQQVRIFEKEGLQWNESRSIEIQ